MPGDRIGGSGSIPPERLLEVDELWNALLAYLPEKKALEYLPPAAVEWKRWQSFRDLEVKIKPYLDRLPEDLLFMIGVGVTNGDVKILNVTRDELVAWYFKEDL